MAPMKAMRLKKGAYGAYVQHAPDTRLLLPPYSTFFRELYNSRRYLRPVMHPQLTWDPNAKVETKKVAKKRGKDVPKKTKKVAMKK